MMKRIVVIAITVIVGLYAVAEHVYYDGTVFGLRGPVKGMVLDTDFLQHTVLTKKILFTADGGIVGITLANAVVKDYDIAVAYVKAKSTVATVQSCSIVG